MGNVLYVRQGRKVYLTGFSWEKKETSPSFLLVNTDTIDILKLGSKEREEEKKLPSCKEMMQIETQGSRHLPRKKIHFTASILM